jgi:hypothetical protein
MSLADEARAVRQRITARLRELEPMVREYEDLRRLAAEMGLGDEPPRLAQRALPPRPSQAPGGQMAERVLVAIRSDPGKTVAEYAKSLDMPATSLYRPVRELTNAGVLVKRARQLYPT